MATNTIEVIINAEDNASKVVEGFGGALSGVADIAKNAVGTALGILTAQALPALGNALGGFISGEIEAEKVTAELEAVIKSTGGKAGVTAEAINEMANSLSAMTPFEDDAIVKGQSMLLTFTNIGKDVFPMATEAMLNLTAKFGSMNGASVQLGKALNDPIAGVSALSRVGVTFTEDQKAMIKSFMDANDIAGAQKVILDELGVEFGGLAEAMGGTLAGRMQIFQNQLGNIQGEIGGAFLPVINDALGKISPLVIDFAKWSASLITASGEFETFSGVALDALDNITKAIGKLSQGNTAGAFAASLWLVDQALDAVGVSAQDQVTIFDSLRVVFAELSKIATGDFGALQTVGTQIINNIGIGLLNGLAALQAYVTQLIFSAFSPEILAGALTAFVVALNVIDAIVVTLGPSFSQLGAAFGNVLVAIQPMLPVLAQFAQILGVMLVGAIFVVLGVLTGLLNGFANMFTYFSAALPNLLAGFTLVFSGITLAIQSAVALITALLAGDLSGVFTNLGLLIQANLMVLQGAVGVLVSVFTMSLSELLIFVSGFIDGFLGFFGNLQTELTTKIAPDTVNGIVSAFTSINWGGIGQSVIDGISGGITTAAGGLAQAAVDAANSAFNAAKAALGINSPSTLFAGLGENMAAGMAVGIANGSGAVNNAVRDLGLGSANSARAITNSTTYNVTVNNSPQSAPSVANDIRLLQMATAR